MQLPHTHNVHSVLTWVNQIDLQPKEVFTYMYESQTSMKKWISYSIPELWMKHKMDRSSMQCLMQLIQLQKKALKIQAGVNIAYFII